MLLNGFVVAELSKQLRKNVDLAAWTDLKELDKIILIVTYSDVVIVINKRSTSG